MKRTIILLISVVSIFSALIASPIERVVALQYAKQFLSQTSAPQFAPGKMPVSQVEPEPAYTAADPVTGTPLYYIYNLSSDGGFVIVAADTRVKTILGYSFNGGFDKNNIPVNMREWLDEYSSQIAYAVEKMPVSATIPVIARSKSAMNTVAPLLGNIEYDQSAPYNNLCPMDGATRSYTGCVATAMVQIMRYYEHPLVGIGSKTYTTKTLNQELSVDFSTTYYDWSNMLPTYSESATEDEKNAVATLMYHAGVAAEMNYSKNGSAASLTAAARALYEHFDYDIGIDKADRAYYSAGEWMQLIKTELDQARPILMSGYSLTVGHAFVCDGYDADNFVHINWGWGGHLDGYFQLSALNPDGGGTGDTGYNINQSIIYGIQKPILTSTQKAIVRMGGVAVNKTSITGDEKANFIVSELRAASLFGFSGQIALALYGNVGDFIKTIREGNAHLQAAGYGWYLYPFDNISISDIRSEASTTGTFYIRPAYRPYGTSDWVPVLAKNGAVGGIQADITESGISLTTPAMTFTLSEAVPAVIKNTPAAIFQGKKLNVELQITNSGNVEYQGQIGVKAVSLSDEMQQFELAQANAVLPAGETTVVNLSGVIEFTEGNYKLEVYYDPTNAIENFTFPTAKIDDETPAAEFTVVETPPPFSLSLTKAIEMPTQIEQGVPFQCKATIANTGGIFADNLVLLILERKNSGGYEGVYTEFYYREIATETKEVVLECTLHLEPGNNYIARVYYENLAAGEGDITSIDPFSNNWHRFSINAKLPTGIDMTEIGISSGNIFIFPNPAKTFATVRISSPVDKIQITDLAGKIVLEEKVQGNEAKINVGILSEGIYLVNAGRNTAKLVVKR